MVVSQLVVEEYTADSGQEKDMEGIEEIHEEGERTTANQTVVEENTADIGQEKEMRDIREMNENRES